MPEERTRERARGQLDASRGLKSSLKKLTGSSSAVVGGREMRSSSSGRVQIVGG